MTVYKITSGDPPSSIGRYLAFQLNPGYRNTIRIPDLTIETDRPLTPGDKERMENLFQLELTRKT